jgi:hypothetical protein
MPLAIYFSSHEGEAISSSFHHLSRILPGSGFPDFEEKLYAAIYRSGKAVFVEHSPLGIDEVQRVYQSYGSKISGVSLQETLRQYGGVLQALASYQKRRDIALARQLGILVREKPDSSILVIRGAGHERTLTASLVGAKIPFTSYHSHEPMLLFHESMVTSKLALGEEPVQLDLLKSIVENAELGNLPPTQANIAAVPKRMRSLNEYDLKN